MNSDTKNWGILSARFTHGTAKQVSIPSALPDDKRDKEKFWVEYLVSLLPDYQDRSVIIQINKDDSLGGHDVILKEKQNEFGIQVTELTSEIKRRREHIREKYLSELFTSFDAESVSPNQKILISIFFNDIDSEELFLGKPSQLAKLITANITNVTDIRTIKHEFGTVIIQPFTEGTFYIPSKNNIGIDINIDQLSISFESYKKAVDYLFTKKQKSKSPWLVIWSLDFWIVKDDYGTQILEYLKAIFAQSNFEKVFFVESLGGEGVFQANITLHLIKQ